MTYPDGHQFSYIFDKIVLPLNLLIDGSDDTVTGDPETDKALAEFDFLADESKPELSDNDTPSRGITTPESQGTVLNSLRCTVTSRDGRFEFECMNLDLLLFIPQHLSVVFLEHHSDNSQSPNVSGST